MAGKTVDKSWESQFMEDMQCNLDNSQHILPDRIQELFKARLEQWKEVEINFAITGNSGVGKSSFINAIRGLEDDVEGAAETGVEETTMEPTSYLHPTNSKIIFWDLPGIGTPKYPDFERYCNKLSLEKYDTFLILTAFRFVENDLALAKKVKSQKKSFFFIRTKIDVDCANEKRRKKESFDEEAMLKKMTENCLKNLKGLQDGDKEPVFLISNHDQDKWDFPRVRQAILDALPSRQKECLTLSFNVLTRVTVKLKADILRGRIWMIATASAAGAVVPLPGLSLAIDVAMLIGEVSLYKSQLGLPQEDSSEFQFMTPQIREKVKKFCFSNPLQLVKFLASTSATEVALEEYSRFVPIIGAVVAGGISFYTTYKFLHECLNELEEAAMEFLDQTVDETMNDFDFD